MVKAIVNIDENANRILNIVKAKENLKDKSEVINLILNIYGKEMLESELRPEFIKELLMAQNEETVEIADWNKHFGLN
jgi:hypothetical protein